MSSKVPCQITKSKYDPFNFYKQIDEYFGSNEHNTNNNNTKSRLSIDNQNIARLKN